MFFDAMNAFSINNKKGSDDFNYCLPSLKPNNKFIDNASYFDWYKPNKEHKSVTSPSRCY